MDIAILLVILAFTFIVIISGFFTVALFYHVKRYSFVGDASKRVFSIYIMSCIIIISIALMLLILNHTGAIS
ncbi:MAG: hypothetical protein NTZ65_02365 [Candidatus Berkelbacteria bacterium]|nr:hypothetical protein [Candidatus Berkelbacteria bacterium]